MMVGKSLSYPYFKYILTPWPLIILDLRSILLQLLFEGEDRKENGY
jgi:hypothetical protein